MATKPPAKKKAGKPAMTESEKEAKKALLKAETKDAKFKRLAKPRIEAAVAKIHLVGNCAGPGYEYTPDQVAVVRKHLTDAVDAVITKFEVKAAPVKADVVL